MRRKDPSVLSDDDKKSIREAENYLYQQQLMEDEEDAFFDEVAEMLEQIDENEKNEKKYFDEILAQIPKDELTETDDDAIESEEEIEKRIDAMMAEQEQLDAELARDYKRLQYLKSVEMEIMSENYINLATLNSNSHQSELDHARINNLFNYIKDQVRQLGVWSPGKNLYQKILNNKNLSDYGKVQQLIQTAITIHERNIGKEKGFILKRLTYKADKIHENIAGVDINAGIGHGNVGLRALR